MQSLLKKFIALAKELKYKEKRQQNVTSFFSA